MTVGIEFSPDWFYLPAKILPVFVCLLLDKAVCKTLLTSHSGWTLDFDHVRQSHNSMTLFVRLYSNHKLESVALIKT